MADPGAFGVYQWVQKVPLADQWQHMQVGGNRKYRKLYLGYWIEKAEADPWTYSQLRELLGSLMDSGERIPGALQSWANAVAVRRAREPRRTGPKSDRRKDAWVYFGVRLVSEMHHVSEREAKRRIGRLLHLSEDGVESARRRGLAVCQLAPK